MNLFLQIKINIKIEKNIPIGEKINKDQAHDQTKT